VILGDRGSWWRCLLVWVSGTSTLATLALPAGAEVWAGRTSLAAVPVDRAMVDLAAAVLLGCAAWWWLALSATVIEARRGASATRRAWHLPTGVRRAVLAACGVALASSGVAEPAVATDGGSHRQPYGSALLTGLPLPDRAVAPPAAATRRRTHTVVVHPGDSLWSIAERELLPSAPARAVDSRWHAVYAANRRLIGPDPDLIEPGQRLRLPPHDPPREDRP
jgi:hypothetical protein